MSKQEQEQQASVIEQRIIDSEVPHWYVQMRPRICLSQLVSTELVNPDAIYQRNELLFDVAWDSEDYDEGKLGVRPKDIDPKADALVCDIGECTLRIFQSQDGDDITLGECAVTDYCLKEKFEAVSAAPTDDEGKELYGAIMNTCHPTIGGNLCPNLQCDLAAGVSEDGIPGTDGSCVSK